MGQQYIEENFRGMFEQIPRKKMLENFEKESDISIRVLAMIGFIGNIQRAKFDRELSKLNLTTQQLNVLLYLMRPSAKDEEVTSRDLERIFHVTNPTMAGILKRLETKGFIERNKSESDARNKVITLSESIRHHCEHMDEQIKHMKQVVFDGFSQEQIQTMYDMLKRLMNNLEENEERK